MDSRVLLPACGNPSSVINQIPSAFISLAQLRNWVSI
ncbi:MAG: hypothetical protein ACI9NG_002464 [Hyphomonas sp.]